MKKTALFCTFALLTTACSSDITLLENGAYNNIWSRYHMFPDQTVKAHKALKGKLLVPVHNATFNLSNHAWFDPLEKIKQASDEQQVILITPHFGDVVTIDNAHSYQKTWWREHMPVELNKGD
jgi:L-ascorbate metabolism protein UlaG (beta-lactamase superfamily)